MTIKHSRTRRRLRDHRQAKAATWVRAAFGVQQATSVRQRAVRLLEEAIELYQACDGSSQMAHDLINFVFRRPAGAIGQEIGGVGVTLLALAAAADLSADEEEHRELARVLAKPIEEFSRRNAAKNEAGFLAVSHVALDDQETRLVRAGSIIDAIKSVRHRAGLSLKDAADAVRESSVYRERNQ